MSFLTELHVHTSEVSPCGDLTAEEVAERFLAAGYSTIVITNHFTSRILDDKGETWDEKMDWYLVPVYKMREYAKGRLHVLLGAELRFDGNSNDYLLFGLTEEFLRAHPDMQKMKLKDFIVLARENGILVIQAHPFRNGMRIFSPDLIDGIEVFNGHAGQLSRNDFADLWAKKHHLLRTSGSDFHHPDSEESGGILTDAPITSMEQLVEIIRMGNCILHCSGSAAERDGMQDMPAKYE